MTKSQKKYIEQIKDQGFVAVSRINPLFWRQRMILDEMVMNGILLKYVISPSYDGYKLIL